MWVSHSRVDIFLYFPGIASERPGYMCNWVALLYYKKRYKWGFVAYGFLILVIYFTFWGQYIVR